MAELMHNEVNKNSMAISAAIYQDHSDPYLSSAWFINKNVLPFLQDRGIAQTISFKNITLLPDILDRLADIEEVCFLVDPETFNKRLHEITVDWVNWTKYLQETFEWKCTINPVNTAQWLESIYKQLLTAIW